MTDKPYLTLVDPAGSSPEHDAEFLPLPYYPWDERPPAVPLDNDEAATAIYLSHGSMPAAAQLLKVPEIRLKRMVKQSPRLQRVLEESYSLALDRAVAVPIDTLFDPNSDQRAKEWASTKLLQSRMAQGHPFSPAPPSSSTQASLTIANQARTLTFRWRRDSDDAPSEENDDAG